MNFGTLRMCSYGLSRSRLGIGDRHTEDATSSHLPNSLRIQTTMAGNYRCLRIVLVLRERPVFACRGRGGDGVGAAVETEWVAALVGEDAVGCAGEAEGGGRAAEKRALEEEGHCV